MFDRSPRWHVAHEADLDVYVYFNNDLGGHAIRNAKYVRQQLANAGYLARVPF